ncbi:MAG: hypothetical protein K0Q96_1285, partial [Rubrobacteraceae bacterium]|nr:hypothetical protein [Rubrobacteraceae bacterium]
SENSVKRKSKVEMHGLPKIHLLNE